MIQYDYNKSVVLKEGGSIVSLNEGAIGKILEAIKNIFKKFFEMIFGLIKKIFDVLKSMIKAVFGKTSSVKSASKSMRSGGGGGSSSSSSTKSDDKKEEDKNKKSDDKKEESNTKKDNVQTYRDIIKTAKDIDNEKDTKKKEEKIKTLTKATQDIAKDRYEKAKKEKDDKKEEPKKSEDGRKHVNVDEFKIKVNMIESKDLSYIESLLDKLSSIYTDNIDDVSKYIIELSKGSDKDFNKEYLKYYPTTEIDARICMKLAEDLNLKDIRGNNAKNRINIESIIDSINDNINAIGERREYYGLGAELTACMEMDDDLKRIEKIIEKSNKIDSQLKANKNKIESTINEAMRKNNGENTNTNSNQALMSAIRIYNSSFAQIYSNIMRICKEFINDYNKEKDKIINICNSTTLDLHL